MIGRLRWVKKGLWGGTESRGRGDTSKINKSSKKSTGRACASRGVTDDSGEDLKFITTSRRTSKGFRPPVGCYGRNVDGAGTCSS